MRLSREAIEEFREIYSEVYGENLSFEEAQELGSNLLRVMKYIYKPIKENKKSLVKGPTIRGGRKTRVVSDRPTD